jgi:hypothetical protein
MGGYACGCVDICVERWDTMYGVGGVGCISMCGVWMVGFEGGEWVAR